MTITSIYGQHNPTSAPSYIIYEDDNTQTLTSYESIILITKLTEPSHLNHAVRQITQLNQAWNYSKTTMRHINGYLDINQYIYITDYRNPEKPVMIDLTSCSNPLRKKILTAFWNHCHNEYGRNAIDPLVAKE